MYDIEPTIHFRGYLSGNALSPFVRWQGGGRGLKH